MKMEEERGAEVLYAIEEDQLALVATVGDHINYENDWIVDSGCSNHMTSDQRKLQDKKEYKGSRMVHTANNTVVNCSDRQYDNHASQ